MIDKNNNARLADFGLLTIISDPASGLCSSSNGQAGTIRWMSPELLFPSKFGSEKSHPTRLSDCYALGMVIYQTISGNIPFHEDTDAIVLVKLMEGKRPPRGVLLSEGLWKLLGSCWAAHPDNRPSINDVLRHLKGDPDNDFPIQNGVSGAMITERRASTSSVLSCAVAREPGLISSVSRMSALYTANEPDVDGLGYEVDTDLSFSRAGSSERSTYRVSAT